MLIILNLKDIVKIQIHVFFNYLSIASFSTSHSLDTPPKNISQISMENKSMSSIFSPQYANNNKKYNINNDNSIEENEEENIINDIIINKSV